MCLDGKMLIYILIYFLVMGAIILTPIICVLAAFVRWADARQKRLAARER
jgi:hypothetical protein